MLQSLQCDVAPCPKVCVTQETTFSLKNLTHHDKNTYIIAGALILGAFLLID